MDYLGNGSATPMRGKSMTCRKHSQKSGDLWLLVADPRRKRVQWRQVADLPRIGVAEPFALFR